MKTFRIATTQQLKELNDIAVVREYNRSLTDELFDTLIDPEGIHVCSFSMIHEHKHGEPCELHLRTLWLVKVLNKLNPIKALIDCDIDRFQVLDTRTIRGKNGS